MTGSRNILIVDDEQVMRDSCQAVLSKMASRIEIAENGTKALDILRASSFDVVILDLKMPGLSGMDVLRTVKEENPQTEVIVITGYATIESAVEAVKLGAYDFIPKPFTPDALRLITGRALEKRELTLENIFLRQELETVLGPDAIVGKSKAMLAVAELVRKVGPTDSTVLISGESGTGKELVARAIHRHSERRNRPFVTVDCGGLVYNLFESELFGHVKGSFTGAIATKHGRFEVANGGTLFFDEIGNIGPGVQGKLLRAIQEREVSKVGSSKVIKIDVRIIAATNKDLLNEIEKANFREDLFYRLSVVPIRLPPLRERREDIALLANHFLRKYNQKLKKEVKGISEGAMKALVNYEWPGNVRELENSIERAVLLTRGEVIQSSDLDYYGLTANSRLEGDTGTKDRLADVEREHIIKVLERCHGKRGATAELLGIDRKTLREKLKRYGIEAR